MTTGEKIAQNNGFLLGITSKGTIFSLPQDYKYAMAEIADALRAKMYEVTADTLAAILYTINNMDLAPIIYVRIVEPVASFSVNDSLSSYLYSNDEYYNLEEVSDFSLFDSVSITII